MPTNGQAAAARFTLTQQRILNVLADGLPHAKEELRGALWDEAGSLSNIKPHIFHIRAKLPADQDIVCVFAHGAYKYRWIRTLNGNGQHTPQQESDNV